MIAVLCCGRRQRRFQGLGLQLRLRIGLGFEFHQQVKLRRIARHQFGQRGDEAELPAQGVSLEIRDPALIIGQAPQVGVVKYHRLQVGGPAHVEFQAPDAAAAQRIEGRQAVLQHPAIVALAAVGDDAGRSQRLRAGSRAGDQCLDAINGGDQGGI